MARKLTSVRSSRKQRRRSREMRNGVLGLRRLDLRGTSHYGRNLGYRVKGHEIPSNIAARVERKIKTARVTGRRY